MPTFPSSPVDSNNEVRCLDHGLVAALRVSHTAANPERAFYACSKNRSEQCKFFKWADELGRETQTPSQNSQSAGGQERMPQTPQKRNGDHIAPSTPQQKRTKSDGLAQTPASLKRLEIIQQALNTPTSSSPLPPKPVRESDLFDPDDDRAPALSTPTRKQKSNASSQSSRWKIEEDFDEEARAPLFSPQGTSSQRDSSVGDTNKKGKSRAYDVDEDADEDTSLPTPARSVASAEEFEPVRYHLESAMGSHNLTVQELRQEIAELSGQMRAAENNATAKSKRLAKVLAELQSVKNENEILRAENARLKANAK